MTAMAYAPPRDDFFNHHAASKIRDLLLSLPEEEAREIAKHVAYGMLHEQIEGNRRTLDAKVREINKSLLEIASHTNPRYQLVPVVQEVSKATSQWEREYRPKRDASGRFSTREERRAAAKQQRAHRRYMARGGTFKDEEGNEGNYEALRRAELKGKSSKAAFDMVQALSGQRSVTAAGRAGAFVGGAERGGSAFEEAWNTAGAQDSSTNARTYRRIQAGSRLLGEVSDTPQAQIASQMGQFVGEHGPQAEKVMGPHLRRTAYRYRGTEKPVESSLIKASKQVIEREFMPNTTGMSAGQAAKAREQAMQQIQSMSPEQRIVANMTASAGYFRDKLPDLKLSDLQQKSGRIPPSEGVIIDRNGKMVAQASGFADDHYLPFNLRNMGALKGGAYVRTRTTGGLTTEDIYAGLVSGAREVTVVSHSGVFTISFEDDFRGARRYNDKAKGMVERYAKTLDAIQSEKVERSKMDLETKAAIRTEVEEDMTKWPGTTRAEIETEYKRRLDEYRKSPDLRESDLKEIALQAKDAAGGDAKKEKYYYIKLMEAKQEQRLNRYYKLDGEGYATALRAMKEQYPYYIKDVSYFTPSQAKSFGEAPRDYSGGPIPEFLSEMKLKASVDAGYVREGYIRPEAALEGYYDATVAGEGSISGTGKTPAAHTNWANWAHNPTNPNAPRASSREQESMDEARATASMPSRHKAYAAASEEAARTKAIKDETRTLLDEFKSMPGVTTSPTIPTLNTVLGGDMDGVLNDPARVKTALTELSRVYAHNLKSTDPTIAGTASESLHKVNSLMMKINAGTAGTVWNKEKLGQSQGVPYSFEKPGFRPGDPTNMTAQAAEAVNSEFVKISGAPLTLTDLPDNVLRALAETAGKLARAFESSDETDQAGAVLRMVDLMSGPGREVPEETRQAMFMKYRSDPKRASASAATVAELAEQARALKTRGGGTKRIESSTSMLDQLWEQPTAEGRHAGIKTTSVKDKLSRSIGVDLNDPPQRQIVVDMIEDMSDPKRAGIHGAQPEAVEALKNSIAKDNLEEARVHAFQIMNTAKGLSTRHKNLLDGIID